MAGLLYDQEAFCEVILSWQEMVLSKSGRELGTISQMV